VSKSLHESIVHVLRSAINKYKSVALCYLTYRAVAPFIASVVASIILVILNSENLDNIGALIVCGALLSELLYFQIAPPWRDAVGFLGDDFVDVKITDNVYEYQGLRTGARFEYNPTDFSIEPKNIQYRTVFFDIKKEIDDFATLKLLDATNYHEDIRKLGRWKPYNARKRVDWMAALLISTQAILGTILWGFGCYLTCEC